jgi:hypothetical protein
MDPRRPSQLPGEPSTFDGGGQRSEVLPDLTRLYPPFLEAIAHRGDIGAMKYGEHNYRKSLNDPAFIRQLFSHALAHLQSAAHNYEMHGYLAYDLGDGDDLAAAAWGLMVLSEARDCAIGASMQGAPKR